MMMQNNNNNEKIILAINKEESVNTSLLQIKDEEIKTL